MHILFLTQVLPYPPDAGPKVKTWHVLRHLARKGYRVTLASFVRPEEKQYVPVLMEICDEVHPVPIHRSRIRDAGYWLRSNLTGRPFLVERDDLAEMRKLVARIIAEDQVDVIHSDQLSMAQFGFHGRTGLDTPRTGTGNRHMPERIFDAHNAVWTIVERMKENAPLIVRPIASLEAARIKRYEGMLVSDFEYTLAVTEPDRAALEQAALPYATGNGDRITVVPIAVDTRELQPVLLNHGSKNILTLGTLHYPPNADGIRWFAKEVFPLVHARDPEVTLTIVGKNPPADFLQLQEIYPGSIEVTGYVEDLTPYFERAGCMVIAVRAGGGMRVRILEAFARGMPLVTTTVGLEGIDAQHGEQVLVEDSSEGFAGATLELLKNAELAGKLAQNGRRLAEEKYDWQVVLGKMDSIYEQLPGQEELAHV
jgi:glycosyltransferase involved in cell wall biosynthesis